MVSGFVLAGGLGTRMRADKARIPYPGRWPMASVVARVLGVWCDPVAIVRRVDDGLPFLGVDGAPLAMLFEPSHEGTHPLWGVAAALSAATTELAVIAPCDVPDLDAETVRALIAAGPAVADDGTGRQPLLACLPTAWAVRAADAAAAGASAHELTASLPAVRVAQLVNVNHPVGLGPLRALRERLTFVSPEVFARIATGERARLAARGAVDPEW